VENQNESRLDYVKEEETRKEEDSQKSCRQAEAVPQKRKGCCGGKSCKADRPATKGDEQ